MNRRSAWLFPITYALHVAEEHLLDFSAWLTAEFGVPLSSREFLLLNAFGFSLMVVSIAIGANNPKRYAWLLAGLASTLMLNAVTHLSACILTESYSPGTASAVLLWTPMGLFVFRRCAPMLPGWRLTASVAGGFVVHVAVWITPVMLRVWV